MDFPSEDPQLKAGVTGAQHPLFEICPACENLLQYIPLPNYWNLLGTSWKMIETKH